MGELSPWHWLIVVGVFVLLFGARRLPDAARSLGRSARILKAELRSDAPSDTPPSDTQPSDTPPSDTQPSDTPSVAAPAAEQPQQTQAPQRATDS